MKRAFEILTFSGLAVGVHLAVWGTVSGTGADSAGDGGTSVVTVAATSGDLADLVESWTSSPSILDELTLGSPDLSADAGFRLNNALRPPQQQPAPAALRPLQLESPVAQPEDPPARDVRKPSVKMVPEEPRESASLRPSTSKRPVLRPEGLAASASPGSAKAKHDQTEPKNQASALKEQSANKAAQKAAGTGQNQSAGTSNRKQDSALSDAQRQKLMARWGGAIRKSVDRKKRQPRNTKATGTAVIRLTVSPNGNLLNVALAKSAGDKDLDQAAKTAVSRARIPAAPEGLTKARYSFNLPIAFTN